MKDAISSALETCGHVAGVGLSHLALCVIAVAPALAQEQANTTELPAVQVTTTEPKPKKAAAKKKVAPTSPTPVAPPPAEAPLQASPAGAIPAPGTRSGSLTVPTTAEALADIERTPGGVAIVPDTEFKDGRAQTVRDMLQSVPGVVTQPKWGVDARLSIRGSGLTRNYGNRGINMHMDGIPINSSDGLFDLFEIDPIAYRYVEVFKGANALRFGANSLGGAVNFVTPTGYDADAFGARVDFGSFGFYKASVSSGGVSGPVDYFIAASALTEDGYRDHSNGHMERLSANLGYRLSTHAETRFYLNANHWDQRLPGELTKEAALSSPKIPNAEFVLLDQQRNIESIRLANKTTIRFDGTMLEFGASTHQRHVDHPIFQYLDYDVHDYGAFARVTDDRVVGGFRNRLIAGANLLNGTMDNEIFENQPGGIKGQMIASTDDRSENISAYVENSFYALPDFAVIGGTQFLHAVRDRRDRFFNDLAISPPWAIDANADDSFRREFNLWSPKIGVVWDVDPSWQVFGNVSRSAEVPTYDITNYQSLPGTLVEAQTATTYEIGTRGRRPDLTWDLSVYRAELRNEFQCLRPNGNPFAPCNVVNADRTVHQGVEAGLGVALLQSAFDRDDSVWLNLTYTYSDFFFDGDVRWGNNKLPGVGPHNIRAEVLYRHPSGFYVGPNVEWVPESFYVDNANTYTVDPFALLNFKVGYAQEKGWSAYIEGRNLTDERYISTTITADTVDPGDPIQAALFNPGTGRAIYGGVQLKW